MTSTGSNSLSTDSLRRFVQRFDGEVIQPGEPGYDAARAVWNGMIDRRPALVVRPSGASAVVDAIRIAREADVPIAVRSGGHSIPGHSTCDGGVVIDLQRLRGATVDPVARRARVDGGSLLGQLDDAAQAHGLACTAGTVSHTGVAGLTLGGGMGRLQRKLGLTIDCLRAVEVVTADGRQVRASEDEHPDLFWGMRGAGANFGIVTAFEFELWPIGPVITRGALTFPATRAREVVATFRETMATAPDEVMASLAVGIAPAEGRYPADVVGEPIVTLNVTYVGDDPDRDLAAFLDLGTPIAGGLGPQTHLDSQHANDSSMSWGHRVYTKSGYLASFPDELVDAMIEHVTRAPGDDVFSIWAQGGAMGRIPEDATALTGRSAPFWVGAETMWDDASEDTAHIRWAREGLALTEPYRAVGGYVNDVAEQTDVSAVRALYGDAKYERLVALKRAWDPDNVFRLNQNIRP